MLHCGISLIRPPRICLCSILEVMSRTWPDWRKGRFLLQALVRTVAVIVPGVLGQGFAEMWCAEDQHVTQALAA